MLSRVGRWIAAAAALAVVAGACGNEGEAQTPETPSPRDHTAKMNYTVVTKGGVGFTTDGERDVRVLSMLDKDPRNASVSLLSVGPPLPVPTGPGAFRVAFDLTGFRGNGSYKIPAGSPRERLGAIAAKADPNEGLDQSNVLVQHWPGDPHLGLPKVYDKALVPCPLKVKDNGRTGTLRCPKLTDDEGKVVFSLEMNWSEL